MRYLETITHYSGIGYTKTWKRAIPEGMENMTAKEIARIEADDYVTYIISGERTEAEKEKDRAYRTRDNIMTRGCSYPFTHFATITTKNIELANDVKRFVSITKDELNKQRIKYIIVAEPYRDEIYDDDWKERERYYDDYIQLESPYREGFHLHLLTDKIIDFTVFIDKYESDPDNLYCEPIYEKSSVYKAMRYITKFVDYTKSMVEKGTHIYASNVKRIKPKRTLTIKDDELNETKIIRENKEAKRDRENKEAKSNNTYSGSLFSFSASVRVSFLDTPLSYSLNAYKGGYLPYGFIPFMGAIYSIYGECKEKDVLLYGLNACSAVLFPQSGCHDTEDNRKKTRLIVGKCVKRSHTGVNGAPMPLFIAIFIKINDKKSDTGLKGSPIPLKKRLCSNILTKTMRYIVYIEHIPDG